VNAKADQAPSDPLVGRNCSPIYYYGSCSRRIRRLNSQSSASVPKTESKVSVIRTNLLL